MDQRYGGLPPHQTLTEYLNSKNVQHEQYYMLISVLCQWKCSKIKFAKIVKRLKYNKAVLTYKAMKNFTPQYITDLLKPVSETHNCTL